MDILAKTTDTVFDRATVEARAYSKATWRLLPFLFICYVAAYLDRVNVGFAKLQMLNDLKFSETVYGLGAGIFFIGYFLFEVPSNIIMHRVGARVWIARIMITWAIISAAALFVKTPIAFYVMRFLLGVAEAGFFPGIVLYLTYWFPAERRSRMNALFMMGIPIAGVVGGPLSGWIMNAFQGVGGWSNWQWLFLLEAIPSAILGVVTLFCLPNGIRAARWLTDDEKQVLEANIERDSAGKTHGSLAGVFTDARIWRMAAIYFCCMMGLYGISFYLPTLVKATGVKSALDVGLLSAIPYACAVASMFLVARSADRTGERRWHFAIPAVLAGAGLFASTQLTGNIPLAMIALTVGTAGMLATMPVFWTYPSAIVAGGSAAAAIGMINSIGNLAGFVSASIIGWMKDVTHSTNAGIYCVAGALVLGAVLALRHPRQTVNR
ncbi:major facilitator transporter [Caballeronia terrestris]|jgi:MFS family permease|uniref:Major facilitator transporter n=1 Tax=Caballeronia terrestris TaxID=1226301 RepID=A0A158IJE6_9BURK|nr:MFS transporter [Caballeronia terrestris]SAL56503.1 major facilitator transporter [Caballeronia terrestris]